MKDTRYLFRLDDASEYMDIYKWVKIEEIFDKYDVKPIFGMIPDNRDKQFINAYTYNRDYYSLVRKWIEKKWTPAMHGYQHLYITNKGGINPVNKMSEFAGVEYERQCEMMKKGYQILNERGIHPRIFFAPGHTFDKDTLKAIIKETPIRIISDTVASDIYSRFGLYFIPQQTGRARRLPFRLVTCCYHPNNMNEEDFILLEQFLSKEYMNVIGINDITFRERTKSIADYILSLIYLAIIEFRRIIRLRYSEKKIVDHDC